jgi:hypothetical protein
MLATSNHAIIIHASPTAHRSDSRTFYFSGERIDPTPIISKTDRDPIASYGSDDRYITLHAVVGFHGIELRLERVDHSRGAQYQVICSEVLADEEDALSVAADMGYVAMSELRVMDVKNITREPDTFDAALDDFFEQARREVAVAAE